MRKIFLSGLILMAAALTGFSQDAKQSAGDNKSQQEIINVLSEMANAIIRRDAAALDRIFVEDYIDTNTEGVVFTKNEILALYKNPVPPAFGKVEDMKAENLKIRFYGDTAIVNVRAISTIKAPDGKNITVAQQYTAVLVKDKTRWRIATTHATRPASSK